MCMVAWPESAKMHGEATVQGAGELTITSDFNGPGVDVPRTASESITRYDGARPLRTTSPHDVAVAPRATNTKNRFRFRMEVMAASPRDEARRDEDKQLRAGVVHGIALEQPAEQRYPADARSPIVLVLLVGYVDAANHRPRA